MSQSILNAIDSPADLRKLAPQQLTLLCAELRSFILEQTQTKAGHIKSSLGVTELTVALHYHFQTPEDILVWDVGHQAYAHKVITDRKMRFSGNRQKGGISGFTSRLESAYDPFGAGHSSTSISAVAGFWKADQLRQKNRQRIAVIGDGALTGGMSFEALNYLGEQQANCLVILNDNASSIDANVGALQKAGSYRAFAESLGFRYFEEAEGNNILALLEQFRQISSQSGPRFLRVQTKKGLGYGAPAATAVSASPSYQSVFGETVLQLLKNHSEIVVISPAMLSGASLSEAKAAFPQRVIDVGIAEQHAVTMAAALAAEGYKPICHLYSTFAQRAADQIIHDVALQKLPVFFALDRAGLVGEDGATHHGVFDVSLFSGVPNVKLSAPVTAADIEYCLKDFVSRPQTTLMRYPKAAIPLGISAKAGTAPRWLKKGSERCIISYGSIAEEAQKAVSNTGWAHLNLLQLEPFPLDELQLALANFEILVSVEENSAAGGLGARLAQMQADGKVAGKLKAITLPHRFIAHGKRRELWQECGLDEESLREIIKSL